MLVLLALPSSNYGQGGSTDSASVSIRLTIPVMPEKLPKPGRGEPPITYDLGAGDVVVIKREGDVVTITAE